MANERNLTEMLKARGEALGGELVRLAAALHDSPPQVTLDILLKRVEREDEDIRQAKARAVEMPDDHERAVMWLLASNLQERRRELVDAARDILKPLHAHAANLSSRDLLRVLSAYFRDQRFLAELQLDWVRVGIGVQRAMTVISHVKGLEDSLQDEVEGMQLSYDEAVGCYAAGYFAASIVMAGRVLEQVLAVSYVHHLQANPEGKGIDALHNALRQVLQLDDAGQVLFASPELVTYLNSRRCTFVHRRAPVQVPTADQARAVLHLVRDVILKAFS